jgi:hypothetical protein
MDDLRLLNNARVSFMASLEYDVLRIPTFTGQLFQGTCTRGAVPRRKGGTGMLAELLFRRIRERWNYKAGLRGRIWLLLAVQVWSRQNRVTSDDWERVY